ncbi:unnamed protein product, partial [Rotaria magnacalcarata]
MHVLEKIFLNIILIIVADGQPTNLSQYTCPVDNFIVQFTLYNSTHSAWQPSINCYVPLCVNPINITINGCQASSTTCFEYRTATNRSYCAPASLCSILEMCDNVTGLCSSNASVCIVNSCCTPRTVCLPLAWTHMCISSNETSKFCKERLIKLTLLSKGITVGSTTYTSTSTTSTTTSLVTP